MSDTPASLPPASEESTGKKRKIRVIDSLWTFLVATACFGPFALPLLWRNPRFKVRTKVLGSIAVLLFTYLLMKYAYQFITDTLKQFDELENLNL